MNNEKAAMADERTPLIAIVPTRPHRDRYSHHTLRYVCTIVLSAVLVIGIASAVLVLTVFTPDSSKDTEHAITRAFQQSWTQSASFGYKDLQETILTTPDADKAREWSQYYTAGPHLAGKNLSQALWTQKKWQEFGIEDSAIVDYEIYVNYPTGHRLALLERGNGTKYDKSELHGNSSWTIKYEAKLEEDVLEEDATSGLVDRIPTFHGYSASGNVTAPYVFVNYGTYKDFEQLVAANVSLKGNIALIKYGGVFRGLKVKRAQELGMVGAIIYSDPGDDGEYTEDNGFKMYPDGPARNPSSVQRGSCQFLSTFVAFALPERYTKSRRFCTRRPYDAWLPLEAGCTAPARRPRDSVHPLDTYLVHRRAPASQGAQRTRSQSSLVQQRLGPRRSRLQRRQVQHRALS
jgi:N-acetylated-alpha-linked acidic dipeptidase